MESIKELLDRYWNCETSLEEEKILREWFLQEDIPAEFRKYRSVFLLQNNEREVKADPALSQKILNAAKEDIRQTQKPILRFYPFIRVAASVLIVISAGIGFYTHYQQEKFLEEQFSETYTNPEDALKETRAALGKISASLSKAQDAIDELELDSISSHSEDSINAEK